MKKLLIFPILFILSCSTEPEVVHGCVDSTACNYNSSATIDNNSCKFMDNCEVCDADITNDCTQDCVGTWGGTVLNDDCGICNGDNSSCVDCNGDINGSAYLDGCENCVDGNTGEEPCPYDCNGIEGGTAFIDNCGECVDADNASCVQGCDGNWLNDGTQLVDDECGICDGDNSACADCAGLPNGDAVIDDCGICDDDILNDCNILALGSQLTDLVITSDSNTLIVADKGNNQVRFIDVSIDEMSIISNVWVGSEPTSLELTGDGQYLLVGLQASSSVAVVSVLGMGLLGTILLEDDGVYDIEYINSTDQLVVSFVASNPTYNKTTLYDLDNWTNFIATPSTVQIGNNTVVLENDYAGFISVSDNEEFVYIIDRFGGIDRVYKYNISGNWLSPESYSAIVGNISSFHDIEYVPDFGVVVAVGGIDPFDEENLDYSPVFNLNDLSHIANFGVGSTPLALAYDSIGEHIYISPSDVDDNEMYIIEYSILTQLQTNYYPVSGRLGSHALVVDANGEFIYAAAGNLSEQDADESFNIQRIKILPENE